MPLGRMITPEEVAQVVVGTLELPLVVSGCSIPVTGGFA